MKKSAGILTLAVLLGGLVYTTDLNITEAAPLINNSQITYSSYYDDDRWDDHDDDDRWDHDDDHWDDDDDDWDDDWDD